MAGFIDEFLKSYGPEVTKQMSSHFNVDQGTVQKLIPRLAPLDGILCKVHSPADSPAAGKTVSP